MQLLRLRLVKSKSDYLFTNIQGEIIHNRWFAQIYERALREIIELDRAQRMKIEGKRYKSEDDIKYRSPHSCRHTFGTRLEMQGESPYVIAKLMRHKSPKSKETYIHADKESIIQAIQSYTNG